MRAALFALLLLCAQTVCAQAALDPAQEERFARIAAELRCLVCQNQSIADSNADLAVDLRQQIREQIAAGRSDAEIKTYMSERYGDFVLYRPPFKATTWLLWVGPLLLLAGGTAVLIAHLRSRRRSAEVPQLSAEERAKVAALLRDEESRR
jgi:cytochrome c-type biogenesis protein CcmH/NrfF